MFVFHSYLFSNWRGYLLQPRRFWHPYHQSSLSGFRNDRAVARIDRQVQQFRVVGLFVGSIFSRGGFIWSFGLNTLTCSTAWGQNFANWSPGQLSNSFFAKLKKRSSRLDTRPLRKPIYFFERRRRRRRRRLRRPFRVLRRYSTNGKLWRSCYPQKYRSSLSSALFYRSTIRRQLEKIALFNPIVLAKFPRSSYLSATQWLARRGSFYFWWNSHDVNWWYNFFQPGVLRTRWFRRGLRQLLSFRGKVKKPRFRLFFRGWRQARSGVVRTMAQIRQLRRRRRRPSRVVAQSRLTCLYEEHSAVLRRRRRRSFRFRPTHQRFSRFFPAALAGGGFNLITISFLSEVKSSKLPFIYFQGSNAFPLVSVYSVLWNQQPFSLKVGSTYFSHLWFDSQKKGIWRLLWNRLLCFSY